MVSFFMINRQDDRFLLWLQDRDDLHEAVARRLPTEVIGKDNQAALAKLLKKEPLAFNGAKAFSDAEAITFLQNQMLAILGREAARAQKTGELAAVNHAIDLLDDCRFIT